MPKLILLLFGKSRYLATRIHLGTFIKGFFLKGGPIFLAKYLLFKGLCVEIHKFTVG